MINFNPAGRNVGTTIGLMDRDIPKIILSQKAHDKMVLYVHGVTTEIGWLGSLEEVDGNFFIEDVFLLEQTVNGANTTITGDGVEALIMELLESGRKDVINKLKFWGHSHVNMDVEPSAQDVDTLEMLKSDVDPDYFLRGIFNKQGKIKFTLYYYSHHMVIDNVKWKVEDTISPELASEIEAEIEDKVIKSTPPVVVYGGRYTGQRLYGNDYNGINGKRENNSGNGNLPNDIDIDDIDFGDGFDSSLYGT